MIERQGSEQGSRFGQSNQFELFPGDLDALTEFGETNLVRQDRVESLEAQLRVRVMSCRMWA